MRTISKLLLAAMVIVSLVSCGGGSTEEDPADKYVGTWKSPCINSAPIYFKTRTQTKINSTQLAVVSVDEYSFTDMTCSEKYLNQPDTPTYSTITLSAKTTFLGQTVDTASETFNTGEVAKGYMTADSKQMLVVNTISNQPLTRWGIYSPYTKQ